MHDGNFARAAIVNHSRSVTLHNNCPAPRSFAPGGGDRTNCRGGRFSRAGWWSSGFIRPLPPSPTATHGRQPVRDMSAAQIPAQLPNCQLTPSCKLTLALRRRTSKSEADVTILRTCGCCDEQCVPCVCSDSLLRWVTWLASSLGWYNRFKLHQLSSQHTNARIIRCGNHNDYYQSSIRRFSAATFSCGPSNKNKPPSASHYCPDLNRAACLHFAVARSETCTSKTCACGAVSSA